MDATLGGGGHTRAVLAAHPANRVLACDRDATALDAGRLSLGADAERVEFVHDDYRNLPGLLAGRSDLEPLGVVVDMGISTIQLLDPERGFAFRLDGPLDMRMNRTTGRSAAELVNELVDSPGALRRRDRTGDRRGAARCCGDGGSRRRPDA